MLNKKQYEIITEIRQIKSDRAAEILIDLFEGWLTNPENTAATCAEKAEAIFLVRKLAAVFRAADKI